jgi:calcium permeable stress-gated cation channel
MRLTLTLGLKSTLRRRLRLHPEKNADGHHVQREKSHKHESNKKNGDEEKDKQAAAKSEEDKAKAQEEHDHPTAFAQGGDAPPPATAANRAVPFPEPGTPSTAASPPANANGTTPLLPGPNAAKPPSRRSSTSSHSSHPSSPHPMGGIEIAPAAAALRDNGEEDAEEEFEEHAFDHPSTYADQPWIWLPHDALGFSDLLAEDLRSAGVDASDLGATMDGHGTVEVNRNPPDEEWAGGHDR